jgi:hypothetical protein
VYVKGDTLPVRVDSGLLAAGWVGGQGLQWVDSVEGDLKVTQSSGYSIGFALSGSREPSDLYTNIYQNQLAYGFVILCMGTWVMETRSFEVYTYASRQAGPLVLQTYRPGDPLYYSLSGLITAENEWSLTGDPRGPSSPMGIVGRGVLNGYIVVSTLL